MGRRKLSNFNHQLMGIQLYRLHLEILQVGKILRDGPVQISDQVARVNRELAKLRSLLDDQAPGDRSPYFGL